MIPKPGRPRPLRSHRRSTFRARRVLAGVVALLIVGRGRDTAAQDQNPPVAAIVSAPVEPGLLAQQDRAATDNPPKSEDKRIFWIIPNYRTSPSLTDYMALTPQEKFKIATEDSFDRGTVALAALFGGEAQFTNSTPSFGHGVTAYARYAGASYVDFVVGNFMTEAVYPTILHQDPRYFRRETGSGWSRLGYAVGQIFWTHADSGRTQFNFSEIVGNSTAVAIATAYYPDNRNVGDGVSKLGIQLGVDMAANILKEFWPDLNRAFSRKHHESERP